MVGVENYSRYGHAKQQALHPICCAFFLTWYRRAVWVVGDLEHSTILQLNRIEILCVGGNTWLFVGGDIRFFYLDKKKEVMSCDGSRE